MIGQRKRLRRKLQRCNSHSERLITSHILKQLIILINQNVTLDRNKNV